MIFINNKYTKWYFQIMDRAKMRSIIGYKERHHVIPKSLGGTDRKENILELTAREHYIAHLLLPYMVSDKEHRTKMWRAYWCMSKLHSKTHERYTGPSASRFYEKRRERADFGSGNRSRIQSIEEKQKRSASLTGRKVSAETKKKIGNTNRERSKNRPPISDDTRQKISEAGKGRIWSDESRKKASISAKKKIKKYGKPKGNCGPKPQDWWDKYQTTVNNRPDDWKMTPRKKVTCPHCLKTGDITGLKRYHFDNCKSLSASSS